MSIYEEEQVNEVQEPECGFCWDRRKHKSIELFFLDRANNMRPCQYCPVCGREYKEEE